MGSRAKKGARRRLTGAYYQTCPSPMAQNWPPLSNFKELKVGQSMSSIWGFSRKQYFHLATRVSRWRSKWSAHSSLLLFLWTTSLPHRRGHCVTIPSRAPILPSPSCTPTGSGITHFPTRWDQASPHFSVGWLVGGGPATLRSFPHSKSVR